MNGDDLAPLLVPADRAEIGFRSGTVLEWDPVTGHNTVNVAGATLSDLPLLNVGELVSIRAGDVVGMLRVKSALFILGRVIVPGAAPVAGLTLATGTVFAEQNATTISTVATLYGDTDPAAAVVVPEGFTRAHVTMIASVGSSFTTTGSVSVQPALRALSTVDWIGGPAINSGNSSVSVATSFWARQLDVTPGETVRLAVNAIRAGTATANSGNWHLAASVIFTR